MSEIVIEEYYKKEAKELTDFLFDKGFLSDDLTRQSIDWLEDYLGYIIQTKSQMAVKANDLSKSIRNLVARRGKDNANGS